MNIFSFIKSRVSILDVVNEYTTLAKAGLYWKATCPFHSEKDASFTVSPHKEIFYCFGCHEGGDVITFIEKIEKCTPHEAALFLADRYSISIPDNIQLNRDTTNSLKSKERYFLICQVVAQWASESLFKSKEVVRYFDNRKITNQSIKDYNLGYFPGGQWGINSLLQAAKKKNILPSDLIEVHIIIDGKGGLYSPFEERIIFPIRDHLGRFCGFGGRVFRQNDERAKYYNSRENSYFQKGKLIFGMDLAKPIIQKTGEAFFVEGYTDCIAMRQYGIKNTVSTLGTACTVDHLHMISRYCKRVVVLYDGDCAGQKAILRLAELCWQVSLEPTVVSLPADEDPASFLSKNGDLSNLIACKRDIFEFFLESLGADFHGKTLGDRLAIIRKVIGIIAGITDSLKRAMLLQRASTVFAITSDLLQQELDKVVKRLGHAPAMVGEKEEHLRHDSPYDIPKLEKKIFFAILNNIQLFNSENESYLLGYFSEPLQNVLKALQKAKLDNRDLDFRKFFNILEKNDQRLVSGILLENDQEIKGRRFEYLIDQLRRKQWKRMVYALRAQMGSKKSGSGFNNKLLNDFLILKQKMFKKGRI